MSSKRRLPVLSRASHAAAPQARGVRVELPDGSAFSLDRRDFLRLGAMASAAAGLAGTSGCAPPAEQILPLANRPEEARIGLPLHYATTCFGCSAGCGAIAVAREGRVIKLEGNPEHPVNQGALCARGQAAVLDLYDPDRLRGCLRQARAKAPAMPVPAPAADEAVAAALAGKNGTKPRVALLTGAMSGRGLRELVHEFVALFPEGRHVAWEPMAAWTEHVAEAQARCYGDRVVPQLRPDRADLIVSFGSEMLDTWLSPLEQARLFGSRRHPDGEKPMSKLVVFEGRMSLTGSNADKRFRVRTSQLSDVALGLAHAVIVEKKHGPLSADPAVAGALAGHGVEAVATRTGVPADALRQIADALVASAGKSLVVGGGAASTGASGLTLEVAVNLLNTALSNDGVTVDPQRAVPLSCSTHGELTKLVDDLRAGKVDVLIVHGTNPVYAAPPALAFAEAMAHVPMVVAVADRVDETASLADVVVGAAHALECWQDASPNAQFVAVAQPAMRPIGEMRGLGDVLARWATLVGVKEGGLATAEKAAAEKGAVPSATFHYLREQWRTQYYPAVAEGTDFETFWRDALHAGVLALKRDIPEPGPRGFRIEALRLPASESPAQGELELALFPAFGVYDGRGANNGWLLEYPDPVTRVTWDSWVGLSRKRMAAMGLKNGDVCEVAVGEWRLRTPAMEIPGQHDDVASLPLGWGRTAAGAVGSGLGVNGFLLTASGPLGPQFAGHRVTVRKTGEHVTMAVPQGSMVIDLSVRPLLPFAKLSEVKADPKAGTERPKGDWSIWPGHAYPETRWGMSVDLSKCIGCGACTIACQAENNIPTAGKKGVIHGREMHWLRVDRYYRMPVPRTAQTREQVVAATEARKHAEENLDWLDDPEVIFHPLMCQHCENAPCETVCPVGATNHSSDGLNVQAYNRCVGTRYCSNNCPFKARRFNWFDYSKDQSSWLTRVLEPALPQIANMNSRWPLPLKNNPEVTVRSRGVMEKCTFCVQRIEKGRGRAKDEDRKVRDGDVVTACMQTCPTQAIQFGNLVDPESAVAKLRSGPRALTMLDEQKLGTSVTYLTKVRNDEG